MIKFYGYAKCSTCRQAAKALEKIGVPFQEISIVEQPPTKTEIELALKQEHVEIKHLLNTSGVLYREMGLKDKISGMKKSEIVDLLTKNGKLVKRPFITDGKKVTLGYRDSNILKVWS